MQIRTPAAAGMFYPGEANQLKKTIQECVSHEFGPGKTIQQENDIVGIICPHAGYMYSGPIACHSFQAIQSKQPELFIIVGPNHWGLGCNVATMKDCQWKTPIGLVDVDSESSESLKKISDIVEIDFFSHTKEHSLEVQIPMLQEFFQSKFKILPIALIDQEKDTAIKIGHAIAEIAKKKNAMIIGSSDFTHYEPNDFAHEQDKALIETILKMDIDEFYKVLKEKQITACGYGAIAATMIASKDLGATKGSLLKYATSGDVSGEKTSVVGYGSIVFS